MEKRRSEPFEEFFNRVKKANPNVRIDNTPVKSNKRDSFAENMKSQEQADFFMKMLKMLQQEQKEKEQKEK